MTPAEHQLMFEILKEQRMVLATIVEILRARDLIKEGDLAAYDDLLRASGKWLPIEKQLADSYRECGIALGIETDLILSTEAPE